MNKYLEVINKCVDSDGYSSSPGFIGFFERDDSFSEGLCNEAVNLLFRACDPCINHYVLVCNLFVVGDDTYLREAYDLTDKSFRVFIHPLIASGVVRRKTGIDDSDWEMNAETTSVLEDATVELLRKTFFGIMGVGGI